MALPNFLIVGAGKSGTTSLYHYLRQHPDICMASKKEPKFFMDWRGSVKTLSDYEALFSGCARRKALGEATVNYLYDKEAPLRIRETLPDVKIIIILRNPSEMIFAMWRHMSRLGKRGEWLSFRDAVEAEPKRMSDPNFRDRHKDCYHGNFYYFDHGLYYNQVKRYMDGFGRDNVRVYIFEDFKKDPLSTCRDIFNFLGVDEKFEPAIKSHNVGVEVRHRGLAKLVNSPPGYLVKLGRVLPSGLAEAVKKRVNSLNRKQPPRLDDNTKRELLEKFRPDIDRLSGLIGRDLSFWYRQV